MIGRFSFDSSRPATGRNHTTDLRPRRCRVRAKQERSICIKRTRRLHAAPCWPGLAGQASQGIQGRYGEKSEQELSLAKARGPARGENLGARKCPPPVGHPPGQKGGGWEASDGVVASAHHEHSTLGGGPGRGSLLEGWRGRGSVHGACRVSISGLGLAFAFCLWLAPPAPLAMATPIPV